jgi:hypothetical protein
MKLRRSLNARPESSEDSSASQVQSLVVEDRLDDGAGVRATDDHAAVTFMPGLPEICQKLRYT